jgi:hypothetical protein
MNTCHLFFEDFMVKCKYCGKPSTMHPHNPYFFATGPAPSSLLPERPSCPLQLKDFINAITHGDYSVILDENKHCRACGKLASNH